MSKAMAVSVCVILLLPMMSMGIGIGMGNETERRSVLGLRSLTTTMNAMDACWRKDPRWAQHRMNLADCAKGFGSSSEGGKRGKIYTVTRDDDDPVNPPPGSLRYGATLPSRLWIVFSRNMNIKLQMPLLLTSHKTIDGRGANVHITQGHCIFLFNVSHVIIHGIHIHHCQPSSFGYVRWYSSFAEPMGPTDGDAISVVASKHIWIDHNAFSATSDGLVDVTLGSTQVTISNNRFSNHDKVMLLGHDDSYDADRRMRVTVAFNHFGPNCGQRMPRVRRGYAHVANNVYDGWGVYAIGGSGMPTIRSEGNRYMAPENRFKKEATFRWTGASKVKSVRDMFINGAYFKETAKSWDTVNPRYTPTQRFPILPSTSIGLITRDAGPLQCVRNRPCY